MWECMGGKYLSEFRSMAPFLQNVIDCIPDRIYIIGADGTLLMINKAVEQDCDDKHPREVLVGKNMKELVNEGFAKESLGLKILETKKAQGHIYHEPEGYDLLAWGAPFEVDGEIEFVVCTEWDIANMIRLYDFILGTESKSKPLFSGHLYNHNYFVPDRLVAKSPAMKQILKNAAIAARTDTTILLQGETGTGKEMVMKYIHFKSPRRNTPLIEVNCAAISENLLESEFFGYVKGAFTGADSKGKPGAFELANHGTLFLDEIDSLSLNAQSKFLRVLQEKTVTRIGSHVSIPINTKIIAATNKNLQLFVKEGRFREDLFYRLNVFPINIPPLRERLEDIPELINQFTSTFNAKYKTNKIVSHSDISFFLAYDWPGNIRELQNIIERTFLTSHENRIPQNVWMQQFSMMTGYEPSNESTEKESVNLKEMVDEYEKKLILSYLPKYKNSRQFAKLLNIDKASVNRKFIKYNIRKG